MDVQRILLMLPSIQLGGMETHCIDLALEFHRRGMHVAAVIPDDPKLEALESAFRGAGAQVCRLDLDARNGRAAQLRSWPGLVRAIRTWQPDVVHVHTGGPSGGVSLVAAARCAGVPTMVLSEHDVPDETLPRRQRVLRRWMDAWTHALVSVSNRNAGLRAARLGAPADRFAVVLNGVPCATVTPSEQLEHRAAIRARCGLGEDVVVVGSLVRLVEGKGLRDLLHAFAIVAGEVDCKTELLVAGDGPLRNELQQLSTRLGVAARVHLVGHQPEPAPFLDAMDVFVLAVPTGSMSIALLEAMARGVTSIITFAGPEEPVIDELTGLTAPPADPPGLARVMRRAVLDTDLRTRLGAAGAAHVRWHYSVKRVADDLLDVYDAAHARRVPPKLRFQQVGA
jgi:glycosyltransferase involved in cell wall biosynthesis